MSYTLFSSLKPLPDDPILGLNEEFKKDARPEKVNLGVGVYLTEEGKLPLLKTVETAEERLLARQTTHGYTAMSGNPLFCDAVQALVFGDNEARQQKRICTIQTLGGTGALRLGTELAYDYLGATNGYVSNPTWGNHISLFEHAGLAVEKYPYYNPETHAVDTQVFFDYLSKLAPKSIVLLHGCCHNPTGADLSKEDWQTVLEIVQERDLIPFVDMAYQGFGEGLEEDPYGIRLLAEAKVNFFAATSCSKNFGLYGERTGALHLVSSSAEEAKTVGSIIKSLVRREYSNPPAYGANIVTEILSTPELYKAWQNEITEMRTRVKAMRTLLVAKTQRQGLSMDFIAKQQGMFSFTGFSVEQMVALRKEYGVYGINNGRICIAGLNEHNVSYVAEALAKVA